MKFSTQVLISLWKSAAILTLTARFSVLCCGLHYFCATQMSHRDFQIASHKICPERTRGFVTLAPKISRNSLTHKLLHS